MMTTMKPHRRGLWSLVTLFLGETYVDPGRQFLHVVAELRVEVAIPFISVRDLNEAVLWFFKQSHDPSP